MRTQFDSEEQLRSLYIVSAILSLLISIWITLNQVIINSDAICYLLSAAEVGEAGVSAAMKLCGQASWPFYSILIYYFSHYSMLSVSASAYFMDACFTMISVLTFITIVRMLGGTRRVLWLAAFVILCSHHFNSVRQYIIRDHGFWAFYLLSIMFLLRFMRDYRWQNALCFSMTLGMATLFRIEGAVFMLLMPFAVFLNEGSLRTRFSGFLKLNMITASALAVIALWVLMHPAQSMEHLGRLPELPNQLRNGVALMVQSFQTSKYTLIQHVLPSEAARDAGVVWFLVTVLLYIVTVVSDLSLLVTGLLIYACAAGLYANFSRSSKLVLFSYVALNLLISAMFFAEHLFLSKRYLVALSLTLSLFLPFILDHLLQFRSDKKRRYAAYAMMAFLFASSIGVILNSDSNRNFVREGADWIAANIPADARMYSNDVQVAYYSGHYGKNIFRAMHVNHNIDSLLDKKIWKYDYVVVRTGKRDADRIVKHMKSVQGDVLLKITNEEGNQIKIFKMPKKAG